jgi:hypothetical protein
VSADRQRRAITTHPGRAARVIGCALLLGACTSPLRGATDAGWSPLRAAIDNAHAAGRFRMRSRLGGDAPAVSRDGVIVGDDEQFLVNAMGILIDERRIDGVAWGRPSDGSRPWISVPSDGSFDLTVLLDGEVTSSRVAQGHRVLELQFTGEDVLRALTHIPSVGPTAATVRIQSGYITDIELRLEGGMMAWLELWDYGAPLAVERTGGPAGEMRPPSTHGSGCRAASRSTARATASANQPIQDHGGAGSNVAPILATASIQRTPTPTGRITIGARAGTAPARMHAGSP